MTSRRRPFPRPTARWFFGPWLAGAWLAVVAVWLVARVDAVGGRPLVLIYSDDPGIFDPHATSHPVAQAIFRHVCEPLFDEDAGGRIRGRLAEDGVRFDAAGRELSLRLRPGIRFQDGAPLDAEAVRASFARLQRLGVSPLVQDLRGVEITAGEDGRTVVFHLPRPDFEFVRLVLANPYAAIVSPRAVDGPGPGFVACTGPYRFVPQLYHPGQNLSLDRFDAYAWPPADATNRGPARIPRLRFDFVADREARLARLVTGDACVLSLSDPQVADIENRPGFRTYAATGGVTYLGFNFQRPRWQDLRARQAVAWAVDRAGLARLGAFEEADTPLAPNAVGYDPSLASHGYGHSLVQARSGLASAGIDLHDEIVLLTADSNSYRDLSAAVARQLAAVGLGQVRVRSVPRAEILAQRQDFDLLLFDYAWADYTALGIFLGAGPRNLLGYAQGDIAEMVAQARATADTLRREALLREAQARVLAQALWQPLVIRRITVAVRADCVQGERQSPSGELEFHDATTTGSGRSP
jgi:peptide/nickel transport system substrate-binding protein